MAKMSLDFHKSPDVVVKTADGDLHFYRSILTKYKIREESFLDKECRVVNYLLNVLLLDSISLEFSIKDLDPRDIADLVLLTEELSVDIDLMGQIDKSFSPKLYLVYKYLGRLNIPEMVHLYLKPILASITISED